MSRNLNELDQEFKKIVEKFINDPVIKKLWVFITCTWRTPEEQKALYDQWRSKPWRIVTWTLKSEHLIPSTAIDIAFKWPELYPNNLDTWKKVYSVARQYWLKSLYLTYWTDKPHLSWIRPAVPQEYINQITMQNITPHVLEAAIEINSTLWNLSMKDKELQDALAKMNALLRLKRDTINAA